MKQCLSHCIQFIFCWDIGIRNMVIPLVCGTSTQRNPYVLSFSILEVRYVFEMYHFVNLDMWQESQTLAQSQRPQKTNLTPFKASRFWPSYHSTRVLSVRLLSIEHFSVGRRRSWDTWTRFWSLEDNSISVSRRQTCCSLDTCGLAGED